MLATIAGDIIGSPYVNNPIGDATQIFFPLFEPSTRVDLNDRNVRMRTYDASATAVSQTVVAAVDWIMNSPSLIPTRDELEEVVADRDMDSARSLGSVFAATIPVVRLSLNLDEAMRNVGILVSSARSGRNRDADLKAAMDMTRVAWKLRQADSMEKGLADVRKYLESEGYDLRKNSTEIAPFIRGIAVGLDGNRIGPGDGKVVKDPAVVIPAVWACLNDSRSWEESVRRGVAVGGESAALAAVVGGLAGMKWQVPETVSMRAIEYLSAGDRTLLASFEKVMGRGQEERRSARRDVEENRFSVIRMEGMGSIYVIPEDRKDIEDAVRRQNEKVGKTLEAGDYRIIRPERLEEELARLSGQFGEDGKHLDGTYVEHARPEVRHLWFQNGEIRSAMTRKGNAMDGNELSPEKYRKEIRSKFEQLRVYASNVRDTLERKAGWNPAKGVGVPSFDSFLEGKLMERKGYRDAVGYFDEVRRSVKDQALAYPGWDDSKEKYFPLDKEAYLRFRIGDAAGLDYMKQIAEGFSEKIAVFQSRMYQYHITELENKVSACEDALSKAEGVADVNSRQKDLDKSKADLEDFRAMKLDIEAFYAENCPKIYGKSYVELQQEVRSDVEAELRKPFEKDHDKAYKNYIKYAEKVSKSYMKAKDAVSGARSAVTEDEMEVYRNDYDSFVASLSGKHLHFASAFYPVVMNDSIEIRQGDILRGRVFIDDDGRFQVDTNAKTGGAHVEGIEGVLSTMNLIQNLSITDENGKRHAADVSTKMDRFREALDTFCLDEGRIEDEQERIALQEDDAGKVYDEARAIRKKYELNVDRARGDMGLELGIAVMPDVPVLSVRAAEMKEERRAESVDRYEGMTARQVQDSEAHKGSVFTIGHSNLKQDEFDRLLKRHGIQVLVDVRSYPKSKFCPHFDKERLASHMDSVTVEYHHFPELGGHQVVGEGRDAHELTYEEVMSTQEFRDTMARIRRGADKGVRIAVMCSESDPMECHRMLMIGRALVHPEVYDPSLEPIDVQHVTRSGFCLSQAYFEKKLMDLYSPTLVQNGDLKMSEGGVSSDRFLNELGDGKPVKISQYQGSWNRKGVAADKRRLYVFTDNTDRDSGKGVVDRNSEYYRKYGDGEHDLHYPSCTTAVIRGLDNAVPVSTQRWYHDGAKGESGRWIDADVDEFREVVTSEFDTIKRKLDTGKYDEVVFPNGDGLFYGEISAITVERTPKLYNVLKEQLDSLKEYLVPLTKKDAGIALEAAGKPEEGVDGSVVKLDVDTIGEFKGENRFLSNFWPCKVSYEGVSYPSVENAYQAAKCADPNERVQFEKLDAAGAKKAGKTVNLRPDWESVKDGIMRELVFQKFNDNPILGGKLAATGGNRLVEGNNWGDTYWGVDLATGKGENRLGEILMDVRSGLAVELGNFVGSRLMEAYRLRSAVVQEKGHKAGVSLKRNMMSRQAKAGSYRYRSYRGSYKGGSQKR